MMMILRLAILFIFLLAGCSGYRVRNQTNPFEQYGIRHLSIPVFVNRSNIPRVGAAASREVIKMLGKYPELNLSVGENLNADAILFGIIESAKYLSESNPAVGRQFTTGDLEDSIGDRAPFYIVTRKGIRLNVRIVLMKNPTKADFDLISSPFLPFVNKHPKILINETYHIEAEHSLVLGENEGPDSAGAVNGTKSRRLLYTAIDDLAVSFANQFEEVVINAF